MWYCTIIMNVLAPVKSARLPQLLDYRCIQCLYRQSRPFSSSQRLHRDRNAPIPKFRETSNPELNTLLQQIRTKLIFPLRLSKEQRHLIFRKANMDLLLRDPITLEIGGERFELEHIERDEIPAPRTSFRRVVQQLPAADWDIFPSLCAAYTEVQEHYPQDTVREATARWIREAAHLAIKHGRLDVVLQAARRVEFTGFRLTDATLVAQILSEIRASAVRKTATKTEVTKALARSEMLIDLLDLPGHCGDGKVVPEEDPRRKVHCLAVLVELAALRCLRFEAGKDDDGKVARYAQRWVDFDFALAPGPTPSRYLLNAVPVVHAADLLKRLYGPEHELVTKLEAKVEPIRAELATSAEAVRSESEARGTEAFSYAIYKEAFEEQG